MLRSSTFTAPGNSRSLRTRWNDGVKRIFDVLIAFVGLLMLSPLFLVVSVLIKRDSPGPIFYRGPRVGKNGKLFQILKFRTMRECPESYNGPRVTCSEDDRITPLGHWLRNSKINELPQLWNVLAGDMSLVGPRPEDPEISKSWPREVRDEILSVMTGITSPASILYSREESLLPKSNLTGAYFETILPDKLRLDQLYVRNRSFLSDIDIIIWTLAIFISRVAKTRIPEGYLFAGPLFRFVHRYISWFLIDVLIASTAAAIVGFLWHSQGLLDWDIEPLVLVAVSLALFLSSVNSVIGLNRILWSQANPGDAIGLVCSSTFVPFLVLALNQLQDSYHWLPYPALPPIMILDIGLLAQLGFIASRYLLPMLTAVSDRWAAWRRTGPGVRETILIVGDGEGCKTASWILRHERLRRIFSLVGSVSGTDLIHHGMVVNGCRILGSLHDLPGMVAQHDVGVILYTTADIARQAKSMVRIAGTGSHLKEVLLDDLLALLGREVNQRGGARQYLLGLGDCPQTSSPQNVLAEIPGCDLLQARLKHSLVRAVRYNTKPALIFIELNQLDALQKQYEQIVCDQLLNVTVHRLAKVKREGDTLARYKPGEFALLFENVPDERAAERIIRRMLTLLSTPIRVNGYVVFMNAEVGVYLCANHHEKMPSPVNCDIAMLHAIRKKFGPQDLEAIMKSNGDHPERSAIADQA